MSYIVTTKTATGEKVPLKGTIWAFSMDRAQKFATRGEAHAALNRAKQFMKASTYKNAVIEEIAD